MRRVSRVFSHKRVRTRNIGNGMVSRKWWQLYGHSTRVTLMDGDEFWKLPPYFLIGLNTVLSPQFFRIFWKRQLKILLYKRTLRRSNWKSISVKLMNLMLDLTLKFNHQPSKINYSGKCKSIIRWSNLETNYPRTAEW